MKEQLLTQKHSMLDLSKFERIELFNVNIYDDGTIKTVDQNHRVLDKLTGDWTLIHLIVSLTDKEIRKGFAEHEYGETYTPRLIFNWVTTSQGNIVRVYDMDIYKVINISKFIKKRK